MSKTQYSSRISEWLATRSDEAVLNPQKGYYPFDIIADAYTKGAEDKEGDFIQSLRKRLLSNGNQTADSVSNVLKKLRKKGFSPSKLFIKIGIEEQGYFITVDEKTYLSEDFIEYAYSLKSDVQSNYIDKGINLIIGFLNDDRIEDYDDLKCDGFGLGIDLKTQEPLF